jgi:hypothetical protein
MLKSRPKKKAGFLHKADRAKLKAACEAFACKPWIAVYVEGSNGADLFLTSLLNYDKNYRSPNAKIEGWRMTEASRLRYSQDTDVKHLRIAFEVKDWWQS